MSVAENIKRIRKKRGFTQKELGDLCGINEANIRKYENNRQKPKIETLQKIANALEVNVIELLDLSHLKINNMFISTKDMHIKKQDKINLLFNLEDIYSEKQNVNNIIPIIENLGFEYITVFEDDKIIICHKPKDIELQQYFYVSLKEFNKIIEECENAKKEIIEETIEIYEEIKLNNLKLLLYQQEKEAATQEALLVNYESKKIKECKEKLKTITKKEEQIEILKELFKELEIFKNYNPMKSQN